MDVSVLDVEALPDVAGARRVYGLGREVSDKDVAKVIFHHHGRSDAGRFLAPHLRTIVAVSLLCVRDERLTRSVWSVEEGDEGTLIEKLHRQLSAVPGDLVVWDGGRNLPALFSVRAMVTRRAMSPRRMLDLDRMLGANARSDMQHSELAKRLGIPGEEIPTDEVNWDVFRDKGMAPLLQRCASNATATMKLWLAHGLATGEVTADDYELLWNQLDRLPDDGNATAVA
jgi:predicted PolB exonuclease-like 3'-5' exonuclease